jgi:hypothetical protein
MADTQHLRLIYLYIKIYQSKAPGQTSRQAPPLVDVKVVMRGTAGQAAGLGAQSDFCVS